MGPPEVGEEPGTDPFQMPLEEGGGPANSLGFLPSRIMSQ